MTDHYCPRCRGEGWCCEAHPLTPWQDGKGCCGEPAVPCELCNSEGALPSGFEELASIQDGNRVERGRQFARLDALASKPDDELNDDEADELARLIHLVVDPEYQEHRRALIEAAEKGH